MRLISKNLSIIYLINILVFTSSLGLQAQNVRFYDKNFKNALIKSGIDLNNDGEIQLSEASIVDSMNIYGLKLFSLKGIESFTTLRYINCGSNNLDSLDLSQNQSLRYLDCSFNQLRSLNIGVKPKLSMVICSNNNIPELDITKCDSLVYLNCQRNEIKSLDISLNRNILKLECNINSMSNLILGDNPFLYFLGCDHNKLINLNLSKCYRLYYLYCNSNQLIELDLTKNLKLSEANFWLNNLKFICVNSNQRYNSWSKDDNTTWNLQCTASINNIAKPDSEFKLIGIYNLLGQKMDNDNLKKGIYIYRYSNGEFVRKFIN